MVFSSDIQAYIFDMDGLLIDSEPLWRRAEIATLQDVGVPLTDEMCKETMGTRLDEMVAYWYERYPWTGRSQEDIGREILRRVMALIEAEGKPMKGVMEVVERLETQKKQLALASSSPGELIESVLVRLGIKHLFPVICSAMEEERGKPDPAVYSTAVRKLGLLPKQCVALEDSPAGVASARAAGLSVVAVSMETEKEQLKQAQLILNSLDEFVPYLG